MVRKKTTLRATVNPVVSGVCVWTGTIPHLTHLQLKDPPLPLHVFARVRALHPDEPQLLALLLPLLLQFPSEGAEQ